MTGKKRSAFLALCLGLMLAAVPVAGASAAPSHATVQPRVIDCTQWSLKKTNSATANGVTINSYLYRASPGTCFDFQVKLSVSGTLPCGTHVYNFLEEQSPVHEDFINSVGTCINWTLSGTITKTGMAGHCWSSLAQAYRESDGFFLVGTQTGWYCA